LDVVSVFVKRHFAVQMLNRRKSEMKRRKLIVRKTGRRVLSALLCLVIMMSFFPVIPAAANEIDFGGLTVEQPAMLLTGTGLIGGNAYTAANISHERSFTMAELKAMEDVTHVLYSFRNSAGTQRIYNVRGVSLERMFEGTAFTPDRFDEHIVRAIQFRGGSYIVTFDPEFAGPFSGTFSNGFNVSRFFDTGLIDLPRGVGSGAYLYDSDHLNDTSGIEYADYVGEIADVSDEPAESAGFVAVGNVLPALAQSPLSAPSLSPLFTDATVPVIVATRVFNDGSTLRVPTNAEVDASPLRTAPRLMTGQLYPQQINSPLFNGNTQKILVGEEITGTHITVLGTNFTRAQMLMMPRAAHDHSFVNAANNTVSARVRGVPLAYLLRDVANDAIIEFTTVNNFQVQALTKSELIARNAMLAYETWNETTGEWEGYIRTQTDPHGLFRLFVDDMSPPHAVDSVSVRAADPGVRSQFKHINHDGPPFNIDAITGATLTVEGPGAARSVPITVRFLQEEAAPEHIFRGNYTDSRGTYRYEGIRLLPILDGLIHENVEMEDDGVVVVFRNRWRQEVGRLSYAEIREADSTNHPIILAHGIADVNETWISPFVYDMGAGHNVTPFRNNGDGPMRLVSGIEALKGINGVFSSVAFLYVEESTPPPGFQHIRAGAPYNAPENTEFILTLTGAGLGREINFTTRELQEMVSFGVDGRPVPGGLGHRDYYSLSTGTFWFVNEYEGINLWELLVLSGIDRTTGAGDDDTLVSFTSWDNHVVQTRFSLAQLADPYRFFFYEKSPLDIGESRPRPEDLSNEDFWPTNREVDGVDRFPDRDSLGYPVRAGLPVLLAYGVNGYPYVRNSHSEGHRRGLGNHGGPMRVIFGKADNLVRDESGTVIEGLLENYAYFFDNGGWEQLQRVQEIFVGEPLRFSTHWQNPLPVYQEMAVEPDALTVEIVTEVGGDSQIHTFSLQELQELIYGVDKRVRDGEGRKEKDFYFSRLNNQGNPIQELFEGVSLEFLLIEHIGLQGTLGTVAFYNDNDVRGALIDLADIGTRGSNSGNGMRNNLGMTVAYAKNGFPMVRDVIMDSPESGYVHNDPAFPSRGIRNNGGPLMFVRGQTDEEFATNADMRAQWVEHLSRIVVNLVPDEYAHVGYEYADYATQEIRFMGAVAVPGTITVGELQTMQRYLVTNTYTIDGVTMTYRGLDLFRLINNRAIGASALLDSVIVRNSDGQSITLSLEQLSAAAATDRPIILAYGMATPPTNADASPLTSAQGGPKRLVFTGAAAAQSISNISEIEVVSATLDFWTHSIYPFNRYANRTIEISGQNLVHNRTYTVAQLQTMEHLFVVDSYTLGSGVFYVHGIDLHRLLDTDIGFVDGLTTSNITVIASDGFTVNFTGSQLANGINGKPMLLGFGQGSTLENGLPLVTNPSSPGYSAVASNNGGPLRLFVHDNAGWSVRYVTRIIVGAVGGVPDPGLDKDFYIFGLPDGTTGFTVAELNAMDVITAVYRRQNVDDSATGVLLYGILRALGVSDAATITVNTNDGFETGESANALTFRDIPMSRIRENEYLVTFMVDGAAIYDEHANSGTSSVIRIYRRHNDGANWLNRLTNILGVTVAEPVIYDFDIFPGGVDGMPMASIRSVALDSAGRVWVGSNGAGMARINSDGEITAYTVSNSDLKTNFVTDLAIAPDGGTVWLAQGGSVGSQNAPPTAHFGFARYQNGTFSFFDRNSPGSSLPNDCVYGIDVDNDGNVWIGTHFSIYGGGRPGGLTRFNPTANTWQTWLMSDGIPTYSAWAVRADNMGGAWVTTYRNPDSGVTEWRNQSYAHVNAAGVVTPFNIPAGTDNWSRSVAIDPHGGVYVTRMHGAHAPDNNGGFLDFIAPNGTVRSVRGDDLIPELKELSRPGFYPEIRTVFVDAGGDLWLATNGLGVFRASVSQFGDISIITNYSSRAGSWPVGAFDDVWSIYISSEGSAIFGSNGGVVKTTVEIGDPPPPPPPDALLFEIVDNRTGADGAVYRVTNAIAQAAMTDVAHNFTVVNRNGSPGRHLDARGPELTRLFENLGINLAANNHLQIVANNGFQATMRWDYLSAARYFFPHQPTPLISGQAPESAFEGAVRVPAIVALNLGGGRLFFGQRAPHEQTSHILVQNMLYNENTSISGRVVITDGDTDRFPAITTTTPTTGTVVADGTEISLNWHSILGVAGGFVHFTTAVGEEPNVSSPLYNFQSQSGAVGQTFRPVIRAEDADPATGEVTLSVRVFGSDRLPSEVATFVFPIYGWDSGSRLHRAAPVGLTAQASTSAGGMGRINGTTAEMEFSEDGIYWLNAADGFTLTAPGQFQVRFRETATHYASAAVNVSVPQFGEVGQGTGTPPPPNPPDVVLSIYDGSALARAFTQVDIERMDRMPATTFSAMNSWPSYRTYQANNAVRLLDLLTTAGISLDNEREVTFWATDGFNVTLRIGDLTAARHYFSRDGQRGPVVHPALNIESRGLRLYFGQLAAQEQISQAFVQMVDRIVVGGNAGTWGRPTASPASGTVSRGDPIRLNLPAGSGEAKIYYTLDGSTPTVNSTMFNVVAERWFANQNMTEHPPILAPSDEEFTVTARIIGFGRADGEIVTFTFNASGIGAPSVGGTPPVGGGQLPSVVIEADAVPLGDDPVVTFTEVQLRERIAEAVSDEGNRMLGLNVETQPDITSLTVRIPAASVSEMIDAELEALFISGALGTVIYDTAALRSMHAQGSGNWFYTIIRLVDVESLSENLRTIVGDRTLYQVELLRDGVRITDLGNGRVTIRVNYALREGQSAAGLLVWLLGEDGTVTPVESAYNMAGQFIEFTLNRLSMFMVGYDVSAIWNPFDDVSEGHWFYDYVRSVFEQGLMRGVSDNAFRPNANLSRGMVVTVLWRQQGEPRATADNAVFSDVSDGTWYSEAVRWAAENGIVEGFGDGRFRPNDYITRQHLTIILARYADFAEKELPETRAFVAFDDAGRVATYASDAVRRAFMAGIINGRGDNIFDPMGNATRAEFAAMLSRFLG